MRELPGTLSNSELHWFSSNPREPAKHFAWLTAPGVLHGQFDFAHPATIDEYGNKIQTVLLKDNLLKVCSSFSKLNFVSNFYY